MSVLSDELEERYPFDRDSIIVPLSRVQAASASRKAYAAGRTAQPTGMEVEAGAEALYTARLHASSAANPAPLPFSGLPEPVRAPYLEEARLVLAAARGAVSVDSVPAAGAVL